MAAREREYDDEEDRPRRRPRPSDEPEEDDRPRRPRPPRDEFEDDDRPRRRPPPRDEDFEDEDDRPVRKRRPRAEFDDEDDFEEDDRPRRRRRRREVAAPSGVVTLVGVLNLVFAGLSVIGSLALMFLGATIMGWITGVAADPAFQPGGINNQRAVAQVQGLAAMGTMMFVGMGFCFILLVALPLGLAGYGVLKRQQWGRILTLVLGGIAALFAVLSLLNMPRGIAGLIMYGAYAGLTYAILLQPQFAEEFE
jgi:hypothetical protein